MNQRVSALPPSAGKILALKKVNCSGRNASIMRPLPDTRETLVALDTLHSTNNHLHQAVVRNFVKIGFAILLKLIRRISWKPMMDTAQFSKSIAMICQR